MPQPSLLVLLEQLPQQAAGTKVRFLGCVHDYNPVTATITLKSSFPATDPSTPSASVSVSAILDGLKHELLETGAWINVIGELEAAKPISSKSKRRSTGPSPPPAVRASMIWSAGVVEAGRYEEAVRGYQIPLAEMGKG